MLYYIYFLISESLKSWKNAKKHRVKMMEKCKFKQNKSVKSNKYVISKMMESLKSKEEYDPLYYVNQAWHLIIIYIYKINILLF